MKVFSELFYVNSNLAKRLSLAFVFFVGFAISIYAQVLEIEVTVDKANVLTCETVLYNLKYKCASTTANCTYVTMSASAPIGMIFPSQSIGLTTDILSYSFSADRRTVDFVFKEPLIAGNTGIIQVQGQGECGLADGTVATVTGTISSNGTIEDTATASTTLHSSVKFCPQKENGVGLAVDNPTTYRITLNMNGLYGQVGYGATSVYDVTLVDMLPANTIINGYTVTASTGSGAVTIPPNTCIIDNTPTAPTLTCTFPDSMLQVLNNYGPSATVVVNVTYPSAYFSAGNSVTNTASVTYTPDGGSPITVTNGSTHTYQVGTNYGSTTTATCTNILNVTNTLVAPLAKISPIKTRYSSTIRVGEETKYELNASNTGNTTLYNVVLEDHIPAELEVTALRNFTSSSGMQGQIWTTYVKTVSNPTYTPVTLSYFPTPGDYVTDIKIEISAMPAGAIIQYYTIWFKLRPGINSGTFTNCLTASASNSGLVVDNSYACVDMTAMPADNFSTVAVSKWLSRTANSESYLFYAESQNVGAIVYASLYMKNYGGGQPLENPVLMDLLPIGLTFANNPGDIIYGYTSCGFPQADNVEVIPNYNGTGRTLVRLSWNTPFPSPCDLWVSLKTTVNSYAIGGNIYGDATAQEPTDAYSEPVGVKNPAFLTGTNDAVCYKSAAYIDIATVQTPDIYDLDGDGIIANDSLCWDYHYLGTTSVAQLESVKWVKGECDTDYTRYPDSGMTMPGGLANYKLIVTNTGNVPADEFVIIDILPFVGDMGVIDLSARLTEWRPNLVTPISAPAGVTIYYSTVQNPCRTDFVSSGPAGCTAPNWTTILPTDPTTIQSVKYDFGDLVLKPGDMIELTWDMRVPVDAPANGEIAWNSFAYKATRMDNGDTFLPAEPLKVGIATKLNQPGNYGNFVWCDTDNDGFQDIGELGIDGVRVELYLDNGDNIAFPAGDQLVAFTSTGNGGLYLFTSLDPGNYYAVFYLPAGTLVSPVNAVVDDTADSDGTAMTINSFKAAVTEITTIDASETDLNWDLGLDCDAKAALGNYVWFDQNQNNIQDEPSANGVNGVQVNLYNGTGMLIATTYTGYDIYGRPGYYLFDNLDPGDYYVDFVLNPGQTFTPSTGSVGGNGSDPEDSDADISTGQTTLTTLTAGEVDLTWDAGIIIPTGIYNLGNFVWFDINNNGIYDLGEVGVNNVTVELYNDYNNDGMPQPNEFITTSVTVTKSGVNGIYNFNNLPEGNYIVLIPESSLQGPLSGYTNSTGNGVAPDPDDNIENDDNGTPLAGYGVVSKPITIGSIAEPLEGGYTNHSVDFGFFPSPVCTMVLNCSSTNPTCGATNGTASVTVTGASGSYSVMWSNGGNTNSISNLGAGIYSVEVTDDICTRTCTVQLTNGVGPTATCAAINNTNCASPNGSVSVTTTANQYLWSNGATTATISNLSAGTFTVTVTDTSTGCTNTCQAIVANSTTNPTVTCGKIDNTNCTSPNGSATATASNVTFSWSNGATTATISNLSAGTFTVTVTDTSTGCKNTCQAIVTNATVNPTCNIAVNSQPSCANLTGGSVTVNPSPIGTYAYIWSNGATTGTINSLTGGSYTVTVTNSSTNCTGVCQVTLDTPTNCCNINTIVPQNVECLDNGTPALMTDNRIRFTAQITNTNTSLATYSVTINGGTTITPNTNVSYGTTQFTLGAGTAGGGATFTVTVTDTATAGCTQTFQIVDPGTCDPSTPTEECPTPKCGTSTILINGN